MHAGNINDVTKEGDARFEEVAFGEFDFQSSLRQFLKNSVKPLEMTIQVLGDHDDIYLSLQ